MSNKLNWMETLQAGVIPYLPMSTINVVARTIKLWSDEHVPSAITISFLFRKLDEPASSNWILFSVPKEFKESKKQADAMRELITALRVTISGDIEYSYAGNYKHLHQAGTVVIK